MNPLRETRCRNHSEREASARCPECRHFYCRECITEHHGKMLCSACLGGKLRKREKRKDILLNILIVLLLFFSTFLSWTCFYVAAEILASIPDRYHDGLFAKDIGAR